MSEWVDPRSFAAFAHLKPAAQPNSRKENPTPEPEKQEAPSLEPVGAAPSFQAPASSTEESEMQEILSAAKKRAALGEEDWRILAMARTIKGMLKKDEVDDSGL